MNNLAYFYEFLKSKKEKIEKKLIPYYELMESRENSHMNTYGVASAQDKEYMRQLERINKLLTMLAKANSLKELKDLLEKNLANPKDNSAFYEVQFQIECINEYLEFEEKNPNYATEKLPDFFSVRDKEQIDYSLEGMDNKKCFCFFDNGFNSNILNGSTRDIRFIWDGFILFTDKDITLEDLKNGVDLYDSRLVALQRTNLEGKKANSDEVVEYIIEKLKEKDISYEIMPDKKEPIGNYPSKCDLWSTRDSSVIIDAIDCVGSGDAYFVKDDNFEYTINFNSSNIKRFVYSHKGALILRGENSTAISRLICNNENLQEQIEKIIGEEKLIGYLTGETLSATSIDKVGKSFK